ncbi:hypothetical protein N658DRAFT_422074 [Parathielavia hyrcaniae]|uniref:NADH-ubiquinone oxidoreductase 17.8 kDa subunit n=1 Tax=Parathielavia hyrcaniae TaxID=113614 RepID=A0AAN6Q6L3_9PEZI|nr:hypothetical protein N658DRAFT_422074 [Parathielavia hyrcaniae]
MSALRQRAGRLALQVRTARPTAARSTRSYASGHGHHEPPHTVEESLGPAFYFTLATFAGSILVYSISRPGDSGESTIHRWLRKTSDYGTEWETKNHLMTAALEQAAHDKHLLYGAERSTHYELSYPEVFTHGSPHNVPAGHFANIDKVVAHYKKQYHEDEARKAKKLAAASQTSQ